MYISKFRRNSGRLLCRAYVPHLRTTCGKVRTIIFKPPTLSQRPSASIGLLHFLGHVTDDAPEALERPNTEEEEGARSVEGPHGQLSAEGVWG